MLASGGFCQQFVLFVWVASCWFLWTRLLRQRGQKERERQKGQANCSCTVIFRPHNLSSHSSSFIFFFPVAFCFALYFFTVQTRHTAVGGSWASAYLPSRSSGSACNPPSTVA